MIDNSSNDPIIIDTLPYTDSNWCLNNLNQGLSSLSNQVYNTKQSLTIFEPRKIIANFNDIYNYKSNRPVTNFSYLLLQNPTSIAGSDGVFDGVTPGLKNFYEKRIPTNFIATEGYVYGTTPTGNLSPITTTSVMNTPYFVNAIQNGVDNYKAKDNHPYTQAAYLFINSLPLATLREKYKTITDNNVVSELDYISSCFKKFGAIHKLPYAWILKYGSIWYRYKKYKQTGTDILETAWKDFNYVNNYDPITSEVTKQYSFKYKDVNTDIILQNETTTNVNMQIGFYPKLINDFNFFYNGYDLYSEYTNSEIQQSVNDGLKVYSFETSNVKGIQNDKTLILKPWSVVLPNRIPENDVDCDPKNNTKGKTYYIVPSFGTPFNQAAQVCMTGNTTIFGTKVNLTDNSSVYNGSVRCLWSAPNFGYYDNTQISYPKPDSYINNIVTVGEQSPIQFLNKDNYSKIEEIFSVFDKKILDSFEQEFLNWSKPDTNIESGIEVVTFNQNPVNINSNFRNFQALFKGLMEVNAKADNVTDITYFNNVIETQYQVFQKDITAFMQYDIIFRYGNPSNYNRRVYSSYLSLYSKPPIVVSPIGFNPYVNGSLPSVKNDITLIQSQVNNPTAWLALETEVGFSTIPNVVYTDNGSYITDFFIDNNIEFTSQNVTILSPIIKMYATQKLKLPTIDAPQFKNILTKYLEYEMSLQNNFLNGLLSGLNAILPNQQQLPERTIQSVISGDQSKVENYEVFKALNDKWISGGDYTTKTLFEDIMFLDRASRNIGDTLLVDIFDLKYMFGIGSKTGEYSLNQAMSVYTFISGILIKNNFNVMNLPAYVNFYNVQDADGIKEPQGNEGSLAFADSLWGTFLDVDYRKSGPKMVCFYAGKPSQYLDLPKGNFKFRDDAFEMRRASENPLIEDQQGKKDWAVSNKCVGFTVDIGIVNQNIFYSFSVSQDNGVATSESINTQLNMVDQASGRQSATQNVSLYNLYKNRSYKCTVVSLGNALIQPTMYFNLRHVPMFNGPYMIQSVDHNIQPGNFQTTFTGIRQGVFDLPAIDTFLQSINQNLLTKLEEILLINKGTVSVTGITNTVKSTQVPQKADNVLDTTNACVANLNSSFANGYQCIQGTKSEINPKIFADALLEVVPNSKELQVIIYCLSYIRTFQVNNFYSWNNNLSLISLSTNWTGSNILLPRTYSCVKVKTNASSSSSQPITHFDTIQSYIRFMIGRLSESKDRIVEMGLAKWYVCYWPAPTGNVSEEYYDTHISEFKETTDTLFKAINSAVKNGLASLANSKDLKSTITKVEEKGKSPGVTPTPTPIKSLVGQICPPPVFTTISPLFGYTGTIIQITGRNLLTTKEVKIANVLVPFRNVTIISDNVIQFIVPKIFTGDVKLNTQINIITKYGSFLGNRIFVYDPSLKDSATTSPGSITNPTAADTAESTATTIPTVSIVPPGVNLNPQSTGPSPLIISVDDKNNLGSTTKLTVSVNPEVGDWKIDIKPTMNYRIVSLVPGPNNTFIENEVKIINNNILDGFVSTDQKEFSITELQVIEKYGLETLPEPNIKFYGSINLTTQSMDKIKNPNPVLKSYNFNVFLTSTQLTSQVDSEPLNIPPGSLSKKGETYSGRLPNFNGDSYYNIKKPAGGYITYQFSCPNQLSKNSPEVYLVPALEEQNITIVNNSDTKYTNVIEVNNIGTFQLSIGYTSSDYTMLITSTNRQEPINGTATSEKFTL